MIFKLFFEIYTARIKITFYKNFTFITPRFFSLVRTYLYKYTTFLIKKVSIIDFLATLSLELLKQQDQYYFFNFLQKLSKKTIISTLLTLHPFSKIKIFQFSILQNISTHILKIFCHFHEAKPLCRVKEKV